MSHTWVKEGLFIYALEHAGWKRGKETFQNRFYLSVHPGPNTPESECEDIAKLCYAAPDLLKACKRSLNWLSSYPGGLAESSYNEMRAAIAKAEGTQ